MYLQNAIAKTLPPPPPLAFPHEVTTSVLTNAATAEVMDFLSQRPLENVMLIGFIMDNGLVSSKNRGTFHGCRNRAGQLEGVALIGHATLMDARTDRALVEFADLAAQCTSTHMIMGESQRVREFWAYYSEDGQHIRQALGEHLMELRFPFEVMPDVDGLRLATPAETST